MVKTYSEAEIVNNVIEVSTFRHGAKLAYLDRVNDDAYDAKHTHVSNVDGVDVRIHPQAHVLQEIEVTVDGFGYPRLHIDSRHAR